MSPRKVRPVRITLFFMIPTSFVFLFVASFYALFSLKKIVLRDALKSMEEKRSLVEYFVNERLKEFKKAADLIASSGIVDSYINAKGTIDVEKVMNILSKKLHRIADNFESVEELAVLERGVLVASSKGLGSFLEDAEFGDWSGFSVVKTRKGALLIYRKDISNFISIVSISRVSLLIPKETLGFDLIVLKGPQGRVIFSKGHQGNCIKSEMILVPGILTMVVGYSEKKVFGPVSKVKKVVIVASLIVAFSLIIIAYVLASFIISPLDTFMDAMDKISRGEFDLDIPKLWGEWGILGEGLKNMAKRIERLLEDVKRKEEELFQAQKMESLGTLAGGIAHEFNNILAASMGFIELVTMSKEVPEREKKLLEKALNSLQRGASLTSQILSFTRKTPSRKKNVDVSRVVDEMVELVKTTFPRTIKVRFEKEEGDYVTLADENQLKQALMNLAINARDAMKAGGELTFKLYRSGGDIVIEVSDTGVGIPEEHLPRIFDPFFTTKPPGEGTGLGLSIVLGIVKRHGGEIYVESKVGRGTTFRIHIPVVRGKDEPQEENKNKARRNVKKVLVVDDEDDFRKVVKGFLHDLVVYEASSGKEALEKLKDLKDEIDLIILDMAMPEMDGVEFLKRLRERNIDIDVLVVTGYTRKSTDEISVYRNVIGILTKPFTSAQLREAIGV